MNKHVNQNKRVKKPADYGDTPVINKPAIRKAAESLVEVPPRPPGLREAILVADSVEAVGALLREGEGYTRASAKTRRQWDRAAAQRIRQLEKA